MEKPFKCPYCEHRSKEKGGLEKHIRFVFFLWMSIWKVVIHVFCSFWLPKVIIIFIDHFRSIHTLEAPYKCKYCNQSFKVQSNMVRHIRAHTGKKIHVLYPHLNDVEAFIFLFCVSCIITSLRNFKPSNSRFLYSFGED